MDALAGRITDSTDQQLVGEIAKVLATLQDGHTTMPAYQNAIGYTTLPLRLQYFLDDGFYVTQAGGNALPALGLRLVAINGVSTQELLDRIAPYISRENSYWLLAQAPPYLVVPELLTLLGAANAPVDPVRYEFEGGLTLSLRPQSVTLASYPRRSNPRPPLYRRNPGLNYWFEVLEEGKTIYIQYNVCQEDPALPMTKFAADVVEAAKAATRIVFDLRNNSGGNSSVINPLLEALVQAVLDGRFIPSRGSYAIIARNTFSSGLLNAITLAQNGVKLVGEPTGNAPNSYGEVKSFVTPNFRLTYSVASKRFSFPALAAFPYLPPDVSVPFPASALGLEADPWLDWILAQ